MKAHLLTGFAALFAAVSFGSSSLVACSSSPSVNTNTSATDASSGEADVKQTTGKDAGTDSAVSGDSGGSEETCPKAALSTNDTNSLLLTKTQAFAQTTQGACTAADIAAFKSNYASETATLAELKPALSASCQSCLFVDSLTGANLKALYASDDGDSDVFLISEACISKVQNKPLCGAVVVASDECVYDMCDCGDDEAMGDACYETVTGSGGACASYSTAWETACDVPSEADQTALVSKCYLMNESATVAQANTFAASVVDYLCGSGTLPVQP